MLRISPGPMVAAILLCACGPSGPVEAIDQREGPGRVEMRSPTPIDSLWAGQEKLLASDGKPNDSFGNYVVISGDTALVSAAIDRSVYVFVRAGAGWVQQQKLVPSGADDYDCFGCRLAIDGDTALVGASSEKDDSGMPVGAVHVFVRNGTVWTETQKLLPGGDLLYNQFGSALALAGDRALVGSSFDDPNTFDSGSSVLFFQRSGASWTLQQEVRKDYQGFGASVAISGDTALVGSVVELSPINGEPVGGAYVYVNSGAGWTEQQKLFADDPLAYGVGLAAALSGGTALLGAPDTHVVSQEALPSGAAYVFVQNGGVWTQQQRLVPSDGQPDARFGEALALLGDEAIIGAHGQNGAAPGAGAAYAFARSGAVWKEEQKLVAGDAAANDYFGMSVALAPDIALVGAVNDDDKASNAGSVYVYRDEQAGGAGGSGGGGSMSGSGGGGGSMSGSGGGGVKQCVPGEQVECACLGDTDGVQECRSDGSGFEACQCPAAGDGDAKSGCGCSAAGADTSSAGAFLGLFALLGARLRRRTGSRTSCNKTGIQGK